MEIIFVLGAIFIAYVVHSKVTGDSNKEAEPVAMASEKPEVSLVEDTNKKEQVVEKKKPVTKKAKPATTKAKPAATKAKAKTTFPTGSLKDPETGDMVKIANSYQMMRRWMKEALVAEGLLEKIYKTSEMDDAVEAKIIAALTKLQKMGKYQ